MHFKDKNGNEIISPGADAEEKYCKDNNIPMFHFDTIEQMVQNISQFSSGIYYDA
jgi:hypothetical protein